eukprot:4872426-Prorocentrum_lima.AAC.1
MKCRVPWSLVTDRAEVVCSSFARETRGALFAHDTATESLALQNPLSGARRFVRAAVAAGPPHRARLSPT